MSKSLKLSLVSAILFFSFSAYAGVCKISYDRVACPGKEDISWIKCKGKKTCVKPKPAKDEAACRALAVKACENGRLDITKSKIISATFGGKQVMTADGKKEFCTHETKRADFHGCNK